MEPMKPMAPMTPMKPMAPPEKWWPDGFGDPASSGSQNGMRYAYFADARRLVIERDGALTTYDSGDHRIGGVSQQGGSGNALAFTSQHGTVSLDALKQVR